jgi:hypothetical protein
MSKEDVPEGVRKEGQRADVSPESSWNGPLPAEIHISAPNVKLE